jgi:hypothetical protein
MLFLFSCKKENQKKDIESKLINNDVIENNNDANQTYSDEVFINFLEKFSKNLNFQLERVVFPMEIEVLDNDYNTIKELITKEDFSTLNFIHSDLQEGTNRYTQTIEYQENKAVIVCRGIDNGIYIDFYYEKRSGKWYLITWIDSST